jgi:hypothetical protein
MLGLGKNGKAVLVTGCRGPLGCETLRFPHFPDGDEIVSLTRWSPITPHEDSWYSFQLEAESTSGP